MSVADFRHLLECGKDIPDVYIFDADKREAIRPPPGLIAWPIEFLLAKHHRKHVFRRRCAPKMSDVSKALNSWYKQLTDVEIHRFPTR